MKSNKLLILPVVLTTITLLTGTVLSTAFTHADGNTDVVDELDITVNSACTMKGGPNGTDDSGSSTYTTTINAGNYTELSGSKLVTLCNDPAGYAIYAIGFSGDSYDSQTHTDLIGTATTGNIPTGTSGNNSYWAMKLQAVEGLTPPSIVTDFQNYHVIPSTYTKVASYTTPTATASDAGATVQTKYKINISKTQLAGAYNGKVKYTMVHPNTAPTPTPPPSPPTSCNTPVPNVTYMQDITPSTKASVLASLTEDAPYYIRDNRDEEPYCVSKLKDGNLWMIDNLRLDITDSTTLNSLTTTNTHVDEPSLISLKEGNRSAGNRYASSGFVEWNSSNPNDVYNQAKANAGYKDTTTTSYGAGSGKIGVYYNYCAASAGSYCYNDGASTGNASYDLCPAGWRMPTGGSSGEYQALYTAYSSDKASLQNALSTPLSGYFENSSAHSQGSYVRFWSSTSRNKVSTFWGTPYRNYCLLFGVQWKICVYF